MSSRLTLSSPHAIEDSPCKGTDARSICRGSKSSRWLGVVVWRGNAAEISSVTNSPRVALYRARWAKDERQSELNDTNLRSIGSAKPEIITI
ncbi:hypothetical protein TNCV_1448551 [Trichonephila clavipes]|nr:hypothetical protein TNCV_1448551 [Trichonephila clavipes]